MTQNQINALIAAIQPNADYSAEQMNPLLGYITQAAFTPLWTSGNPGVAPGVNDDETYNFQTGSLGWNSADGRIYLCVTAAQAGAVWKLVNVDNLYTAVTATEGGTASLGISISDVTIAGAVSEFTLKLPPSPYLGKRVNVIAGSSIGDLYVQNSAGSGVNTISTSTYTSFTMLCVNATTNSWAMIQFSA